MAAEVSSPISIAELTKDIDALDELATSSTALVPVFAYLRRVPVVTTAAPLAIEDKTTKPSYSNEDFTKIISGILSGTYQNRVEQLVTALETKNDAAAVLLVADDPSLAFGESTRMSNQKFRMSAFHEAALNGRLKVLQVMYALQSRGKNRARLLSALDETKGNTALHIAAYNGHRRICKWLIKQCGARVESQNTQGCTALHLAVKGGHVRLCRLLLNKKYGADVNAASRLGSPLIVAITSSEQSCSTEMIDMLIASGADVNQRSEESGNTALLLACKQGSIAMCTKLLDAGADVNQQANKRGINPLLMSIIYNRKEVCELLLSRGANANIVEQEVTASPLHVTAALTRGYLCSLLISHGVNVNLRWNGLTPLMVAAAAGNVEIICMLADAGADCQARSSSCNRRAIQFAMAHGHKEAAYLLFQLGARQSVPQAVTVKALDAVAADNNDDTAKQTLTVDNVQ